MRGIFYGYALIGYVEERNFDLDGKCRYIGHCCDEEFELNATSADSAELTFWNYLYDNDWLKEKVESKLNLIITC